MFKINLYERYSSVSFISFEELPSPSEKRINEKKMFWFSWEDGEKYERKERAQNRKELTCFKSLSYLSLSFSDNDIKNENNKICRDGYVGWKICTVGSSLKEGIHRISFFAKGQCLIGLVDFSQELPTDTKSITKSHIGLLIIFILIIIFLFQSIGVGIYSCLFCNFLLFIYLF